MGHLLKGVRSPKVKISEIERHQRSRCRVVSELGLSSRSRQIDELLHGPLREPQVPRLGFFLCEGEAA
jgi:hypothetical protein